MPPLGRVEPARLTHSIVVTDSSIVAAFNLYVEFPPYFLYWRERAMQFNMGTPGLNQLANAFFERVSENCTRGSSFS